MDKDHHENKITVIMTIYIYIFVLIVWNEQLTEDGMAGHSGS